MYLRGCCVLVRAVLERSLATGNVGRHVVVAAGLEMETVTSGHLSEGGVQSCVYVSSRGEVTSCPLYVMTI
jgi:hypothetical protein